MPLGTTEPMLEAGHRMFGEPVTPLALEAPRLDATGVVRHLRAGAWLIVLCGGLAVAAAIGLIALAGPRYVSAARLLIDPAGVRVVARDVVDRRPRWDSGYSLVDSQVRVIQSDSVLRRAVARLDLGRDPEFSAPGWLDGLSGRASADPAERALDGLRRVVSVRRPEGTFIVDVAAETRDAEKSARIADAIVAAYLEEEADNRSGTARRLSGAFDGGLADLKASIAEAGARIERYRQENGLVTADGLTLGDQRLTALNQEGTAASLRTAEARERLDQARRARPEEAGAALPEMLQSRELRNLRQQYATLSGNAAELATRLGQRHPSVAAQGAQLADLRQQIQREKERIVDGLRADADRAAASEAAIRDRAASAKTEVAGTERAEVGLRELNRELVARQEVYAANLRRAQEIGEQGAIDSASIRVVSGAAPASLPVWPKYNSVLAQSFCLGLVAGASLALWRGTRRDRRRFARLLRGA